MQIINQSCAPAIEAGRVATTDADVRASQKKYQKECQSLFAEVGPTFTSLTTEIAENASKDSDVLTDVTNRTVIITFTVVIMGLVAVLVVGFFAIRSWLVRPIHQLSKTMKLLSSGDWSAQVDGTDRRDEVGTMSKAVQVFKDNGLRARQLEQEAETNRSSIDAERARSTVAHGK